jgi:chitin synthase
MQRGIPLQPIPSTDSQPHQRSYLAQDPYAQPAASSQTTASHSGRVSRSSGSQLRRGRTLTRPERSVAPVPLITPPALTGPPTSFSASSGVLLSNPADSHLFFGKYDWWQLTSLITTWWAPPQLLSSLGGIKDQPSRQAWREKITLCWIILLMGAVVGFATMGLNEAFCPDTGGGAKDVGNLGNVPGGFRAEPDGGICY